MFIDALLLIFEVFFNPGFKRAGFIGIDRFL
jgi:hypothetical protein